MGQWDLLDGLAQASKDPKPILPGVGDGFPCYLRSQLCSHLKGQMPLVQLQTSSYDKTMRNLILILALFICTTGCSKTQTCYGNIGTTALSFELPEDWEKSSHNQWAHRGKQLTLGQVRLVDDSELDLEERAKRYQRNYSSRTFDSFEQIDLAGRTAYLIEYSWYSRNRERKAGYIYWREESRDVVLHQLNGNYDHSLLKQVAATMTFGVEPPARERTKQKIRTKTPTFVYHLIFLLVFCGAPGALGATLAYSSLRGEKDDHLTTVAQATRPPVFLGTLLGCAILGIIFFSEIGARFRPGGNQLAYVALVFVLVAAVIASLVVSLMAAWMAGAGAGKGATYSRIGATLGGALGATFGAGLLPLIFSSV